MDIKTMGRIVSRGKTVWVFAAILALGAGVGARALVADVTGDPVVDQTVQEEPATDPVIAPAEEPPADDAGGDTDEQGAGSLDQAPLGDKPEDDEVAGASEEDTDDTDDTQGEDTDDDDTDEDTNDDTDDDTDDTQGEDTEDTEDTDD